MTRTNSAIKLIIVLFLNIVLSFNLLAQDICAYDDDNEGGGTLYAPHKDTYALAHPEDIIKKAKSYYTCLEEGNWSSTQKAKICNIIASQYSRIMESDSIVRFARMAIAYDSDWYCSMLHKEMNLNEELVKRFKKHHVLESEELREKIFLNFECDLTVNKEISSSSVKSKIQNKEYFDALSLLEIKDQNERLDDNSLSTRQSTFDNQNRVSLDSLYSIYGFPTLEQVGQDGLESAWLVLQHSTDCEWNKKWFIRFLDAYSKNQINQYFLSFTFKRFYEPGKGHCRQKDEVGSKAFLEMLKEKYPKSYGEDFLYGSY